MRPSQKDDKAKMLLATGVDLIMSLLSMAIFSIKLAGMSVPHDVASDAVIQSSQDVESVLPGLVEARAEVWYENGVSALESVTQAMDSSHEDLLHHGEISGIEVKLINVSITDLGSNQIQINAELGVSDSDAMLMKPIQFMIEL
ncbi:MAG: hypothetical protein MKZ54_03695 [Candidatus Poseidoniaceae archaeon]|nr:hypothetical protein [Candidatus Poseidoniaceae archaeon]